MQMESTDLERKKFNNKFMNVYWIYTLGGKKYRTESYTDSLNMVFLFSPLKFKSKTSFPHSPEVELSYLVWSDKLFLGSEKAQVFSI